MDKGAKSKLREHRHQRFVIAAALAALGGAGLWLGGVVTSLPPLVLIVVDVFSTLYLLLMLAQAARLTPDDLRRHAAEADEGIPLIVLIAVGIVATSLTAIFLVLSAPGGGAGGGALSLGSIPLGWAMLHTVFAFHYAGVFYAPADADHGDAGGIAFPETGEPGVWDFLYFSFVIGMTAQVSDATVSQTGMRRLVLAHSVLAFFYNTVILALAVNAAINLGH